jgi:L,D-peptidoglycan transpeptidase YkuD (ErfK/YbiS/YcfS/YnhG family)
VIAPVTRLVALALLAAVLGLPASAAAPATAVAAPARAEHRVTLDGVSVVVGERTRQVVTVNRTRGFHARVTLWAPREGRWTAVRQTRDGRIGYGGLVRGDRRRQDTGTTPLGTYRLPSAFGMHARAAGWATPYRRVQRGDYWVQDNRSRFYNRYRNVRQGGFRPRTSERLLDYRRQYEWAVVLDFNYAQQVRHRGAGIFLHVNGRGATAGCVSVPRPLMRQVMAWLDPDRDPRIAIGR